MGAFHDIGKKQQIHFHRNKYNCVKSGEYNDSVGFDPAKMTTNIYDIYACMSFIEFHFTRMYYETNRLTIEQPTGTVEAFNTLSLELNGRHFPDILKRAFLNQIISIWAPQKFAPESSNDTHITRWSYDWNPLSPTLFVMKGGPGVSSQVPNNHNEKLCPPYLL